MSYSRWVYRCFEAHGVIRVRLASRRLLLGAGGVARQMKSGPCVGNGATGVRAPGHTEAGRHPHSFQ